MALGLPLVFGLNRVIRASNCFYLCIIASPMPPGSYEFRDLLSLFVFPSCVTLLPCTGQTSLFYLYPFFSSFSYLYQNQSGLAPDPFSYLLHRIPHLNLSRPASQPLSHPNLDPGHSLLRSLNGIHLCYGLFPFDLCMINRVKACSGEATLIQGEPRRDADESAVIQYVRNEPKN